MRPIAMILAAFLLAACNLSTDSTTPVDVIPDDETITQTDTQLVQAATEPPTAAPTPTIPPSPTIAPEVLLQVADTQLLNGYYENAVFTYQSILNQGETVPDAVRASAALKLGQASVREGLFDEALQSLTVFINQFPEDSRTAQAYFLRGDALLGLSRWTEAINDFQQYLALRPGLVDSYVYERIADAQLALGQTDTALNTYVMALDANRTLVPQLVLREKVAQIYISLGRTPDAVAQYDAILAVAQNAPYRAQIDFVAAQALLNSGDQDNGLTRMRRVFNDYQGTTTAYQAMQVLLNNNIVIDDLTRGNVSYVYGDYQGAVDAFNEYSSTHEVAAIPANMYLMLGRAYRELGNSDAAWVAFQTIIDQYPQDPLFGDALLEQGRTRFLAGDIPVAIETYLKIANTYDYLTATAAEALWRAGYLYGTNNNPTASREVFVRLADTYPDTEQAQSGLFIAASAAVTTEQWDVAENLYTRLAAISTGDDQAAAYLWVARLALRRNDTRVAEEALALTISSSPDSYYAARASDIQNGREPFQQPLNLQFEFDDSAALAEAENWLRATFSITTEGVLWQLSPDLDADPRLVRGRELWVVGAYDEAEDEFEDLVDEKRNAQDVLASYQLAIYLRTIGAYRDSIIAAADVIRAAGVSTLEAPAYLARMRYPVYYRDVVLDVSSQFSIDPLLMFSLIRHESLFNTNATAAAGEKGLTQVIPGTGQYIAKQLAWPDYQHSDLFRPYAGVTFGAFYLEEQLTRFDGNVVAALSGYNAGPGRASDWLALSGGDPDLFMTTITIDSTRTYVQRIYGYHNIYRVLYGAS